MEELLNSRSKEELVKLAINYRKQLDLLRDGREIERFDAMASELDALRHENELLKSELAARPASGLPGAGRKRKASDTDIDIIQALAEQGLSLSEIATQLQEKTGTKLSRSTVRNMILK